MREEVNKFKKENGSVIYSTKELIGALHVKTDHIIGKLDKKLDKTTFWKIMAGLVALLTIIVGVVK